MHTLILTADEYDLLQQVFDHHFHQREAYMERLVEALLVHSSAIAGIAPHDQRTFIQTNAPEYLFQKRGIALDRELLSEIRRSLSNQRTMAMKARDFYHIANLVVAALAVMAPAITSLYTKIQELADHPIGNDEKVVLVLRVDFADLI